MRYRSEGGATRRLAQLMMVGLSQCRVYHCQWCEGWHLTSQATRRRTGEPTALPAGFMALLTLPGHDPGPRQGFYKGKAAR